MRVTSTDFDQTVISGSKTEYGSSGWEVYLGDAPVDQTFTVQLLDNNNLPLSDTIDVQMIPECDSNLAFLVFDEVD